VLSADRPPELIDCGANQAIRQPGLFSSHPSQTVSLPRPTQDIPASWLVSTVDHAMETLRGGALHINCPFAEPLYGELDDTGLDWQRSLGDWWGSEKPWLHWLAYEYGCLLTGQQGGLPALPPEWATQGFGVWLGQMVDWAQTLGWPLLLGVPALGLTLGLAGHGLVMLAWRWHTVHAWRHRRHARKTSHGSD